MSTKSSPSPASYGLHAIVREQFQKAFKTCCDAFPGWMVLVLDGRATKVMSSSMGMYELMEHRITLAEDINKDRAPFRDMGVVYFIDPTESNIDKIIADFSGKKKKYGDDVFIFTLSACPDKILGKVKACRSLLKRIKVFNEFNCDFLAKESRIFDLGMKSCFRQLFLEPDPHGIEAEIAKKLVTLCATLKEYPIIRYQEDSKRSKAIATLVSQKLNEFVGNSPDWWYHGMYDNTRGRSTLLLIDRSEDPLSPFMHEFTYQAMANDLLNFEGNKISIETDKGSKDVLLNMDDKVWLEYKMKHVAEVVDNLTDKLKEFAKNQGVESNGSNQTFEELSKALWQKPELIEAMSKVNDHYYIVSDLLKKMGSQDILDLAKIEQAMATGQDENKHTLKLKNVVEMLEEYLPGLDSEKALRLLGIFIVSQPGISREQREELFELSTLSSDQKRTLLNLEYLSVKTEKCEDEELGKTRGFFARLRGRGSTQLFVNQRQKQESKYSHNRYVCLLKSVFEDMIGETLDKKEYPGVVPLPESIGHVATTARRKAAKTEKVFTGPRKIVFVSGGVCYSEIRAAETVMANCDREIILGGTNIITPENFIEDLKSLG